MDDLSRLYSVVCPTLDGDTASDIDFFIIRPKRVDQDNEVWREQLDALARSTHGWTGNYAGIAEVEETEIPRLREEEPPVVQNLRHDAVRLYGSDVTELLGAPV